jgi:integrase
MANKRVRLVRTAKTEKGWRRCPVVFGKNGRLKVNAVMVDGHEEVHTEGEYQINYYSGGRQIWKPVGTDPAEALAALDRQQNILEAKAKGVEVVEPKSRLTVGAAIQLWEERLEKLVAGGNRKQATFDDHKLALRDFQAVCKKTYLDDINADDILSFNAYVKGRANELTGRKGLSSTTVFNRCMRIITFLKFHGIRNILPTNQWPKVVQQSPEAYEEDELKKFFKQCTPEQGLVYETFLKTGMREEELKFLHWDDMDLKRHALDVKAKPEYEFTTKTWEERTITLPNDLVEKLKAWKEKRGKGPLVFPTSGNRANHKLLQSLKRIVKRAGLNCGNCSTCKERQECERWYLHKFRATYATMLLRAGFEIVDVQHALGHKDIASTMRYLALAGHEKMKPRMDGVKFGD